MKTIIIWDQCGEAALSYFVVDGDLSHLDKIYINCSDNDPEVEKELSDLIFDDSGRTRLKVYKKFPRKTSLNPVNKIIVAGFLP